MPLCENCGIQVLDSEPFCPICGFNFPLQSTYPEVNQPQQQRYQQYSLQLHPAEQHNRPYQSQYQQPYHEQNQQPKRRSNGKLFKASTLVAIAVLIIAILLISIATFVLNGGDVNGKTVTMSMRDFDNEMDDYDVDNGEFISLDPGDTLKIKDKIVYIDSVIESGETVTYIWFETNHKGEDIADWVEYEPSYGEYYYNNYDITFEGDLTDKYEIGDEVVVTLHIIEIEYNNRIMEYFEEMWNEQYNEPQYQIPSSCLDHANGN